MRREVVADSARSLRVGNIAHLSKGGSGPAQVTGREAKGTRPHACAATAAPRAEAASYGRVPEVSSWSFIHI